MTLSHDLKDAVRLIKAIERATRSHTSSAERLHTIRKLIGDWERPNYV